MKYEWKRKPSGAPKAGVAGKYLHNLAKKRGGVTPDVLVEESTDRSAPLHECFEWSNIKAAHEYRKSQAGDILRSITVVVDEPGDSEPVTVNAFVHLEDGGGYVPIQSVVADPDSDKRYLEILEADLFQLQAKLWHYQEFAEVCEAIDRIRIR
ncbi:MAG: hypothetical protein GY832_11740 [Chloroflexi bacterium]|nr:hypothetical protein [Chloroflexota bacterium]